MHLPLDQSVLTSSAFFYICILGAYLGISAASFLNPPGWEICSTEVNEKIPLPIQHGKEVPHAVEVGLQKAGTPPDGHHPPGSGSDVGVLLGDLQHLPVHVSRALQHETGTLVMLSQI